MADTHDMQDGKNYYLDVPRTLPAFALDLYHSLKSMEERSQYAK